MSDATEWKTIKIPKEVRDDAQDDPRTYGDIMRAGLEQEPSDAARILTHIQKEGDMSPDSFANEPVECQAIGKPNVEEVYDEIQDVMNRLDELPEETARKTEDRLR